MNADKLKALLTEVHSHHLLTDHERGQILAQSRDPDDFVAVNLAFSTFGMVDQGQVFVFVAQFPFGKGIFPDLSRPTIVTPDGAQSVPKAFDHALAVPPFLRMLIKPSALDLPLRRAVEVLLGLEGKSLEDPVVRAQWEAAQRPKRNDSWSPGRAMREGDVALGSALAAAAAEGRMHPAVTKIEDDLNDALKNDEEPEGPEGPGRPEEEEEPPDGSSAA